MHTSNVTHTRPKASQRSPRPRIWTAIVPALLLLLAAPADLHAKKKKKEKDRAVLAGTVTNQAGDPLAGVEVTISLETAGFQEQDKTDKQGQFSIDVPMEGDVWMKLVKEGYATLEKEVFLTLGEKYNAEIEMLDAAAGRRNEAVKAYNAGATAYKAEDLAAAKQHFLAATAADPTLAEPYLVLADIYMVEDAPAEAAAAAEKFLELSPGDQKGQMLAYEAYQKLGNQAKVDELREILGKTEVAPKLAIQVYNEGAIADQQGDLDTAIDKFRDALELDPTLKEALAGLATVYYRAARYDEAMVSVKALLAAQPNHAQGHRLHFLIQEGRGDRAASDAAMNAYLAVDPKGASGLLYQRADLDFRAGEVKLAREGLLKVLELDPENARAHFTLGKVYASTDTAKAKQHLQRFIELAPDDPEVATAKEMLTYF